MIGTASTGLTVFISNICPAYTIIAQNNTLIGRKRTHMNFIDIC
jgi:hypothetical protein